MGHLHEGVLKAVEILVAVHGGKCCINHQGGGMMRRNGRAPLRGTPGVPDAVIVFPGDGTTPVRWSKTSPENPFCFWFDAKVGRDKPSPEQLAFAKLFLVLMDTVFGGVDEVGDYLVRHGIDVHI